MADPEPRSIAEHIVHENQAIRLSDLATARPIIRGHRFENCRLLGPAVLALQPPLHISDSSFEGPLEAVFFEVAENRPMVGPILVTDCVFRNCSFQGLGFVGPPALREMFSRFVATAAGQQTLSTE